MKPVKISDFRLTDAPTARGHFHHEPEIGGDNARRLWASGV
jgi:hypothetical protein